MELRDIIIRYRRENGLSQRAFATKCNLSNGFIAMLEAGKNPNTGKPIKPSLTNISALATGMGMTAQTLLSMADDLVIGEYYYESIPELALINADGRELVREFVRMLAKQDMYRK